MAFYINVKKRDIEKTSYGFSLYFFRSESNFSSGSSHDGSVGGYLIKHKRFLEHNAQTASS